MEETMKNSLDWFEEARYGMFVHWGPYAVAARGEWVMNRERIPLAEYTARYVDNWNAERYDPSAWCRLAREAGMGYIVLTARHHDGFSLWDSAVDDFNAARMGPRRDLLVPYVEAAREAGLKVGLYYSPASWAHPDYPAAYYRDWPGQDDWRDEAARGRFVAYYQAQLRELMTGYGTIDYLWFDGCIPENIEGDAALAMVRKLQPSILVNNRLGKPFDILCCEQAIRPAPKGQAWEACMTLNENWGYHGGDRTWKTSEKVVEMLLTCAQSGGNLLLNIGPRGDGTVPEESVRILREAGAWVARNGSAVSRSERHPFSWNNTARPITCRGSSVYLHFTTNPLGSFCWAEVRNRVLAARWLVDGRPVSFRQEGERLYLENLPDILPDAPVATIELELDGEPEALTKQTSFWIPG
jgi:alpha-L-fucosidase